MDIARSEKIAKQCVSLRYKDVSEINQEIIQAHSLIQKDHFREDKKWNTNTLTPTITKLET
jgi:hypothetical protein